MGVAFEVVVERGEGEGRAFRARNGDLDQPVREPRVLRQDRAVQVRGEDVPGPRALQTAGAGKFKAVRGEYGTGKTFFAR